MVAIAPIKAGELLTIIGGGIYSLEELDTLSPKIHSYSIQVDDHAYIAPYTETETAFIINHSCTPNAGLMGQISFVALRDIEEGEEICYDYAMSDGSSYDEFPCSCNTQYCRHQVTGNDWQRPELWERYKGHFSPYLQRRIDALRQQSQPMAAVKVNGNGRYAPEAVLTLE
jgi:hypothetical protein